MEAGAVDVMGQCGLCLMPRVRYIVERRVHYSRERGVWVWERIGSEFATPGEARDFQAAQHAHLSDTRRRPIVVDH